VAAFRTAIAIALLLLILAGIAARVVDLPAYVPDSGDEWGNTLAPLRLLHERGDPGTFLHPSLFYDVVAAADAAVYGVLRVSGGAGGAQSMADLLVRDERWFVYAARTVSLLSGFGAMVALWALGRRLWNPLCGLAAAALLAVLPMHAVYSQTVRVDSLFLAVFLFALLAIVRTLTDGRRGSADTAAVLTGLAVAANYNGAILAPWLLAALWLRRRDDGGRDLARAALLAVAAFVVASPYVLLNAASFFRHAHFILSLAAAANPGMEGRDVLFYVRDLVQTLPVLAIAIAIASLAMALLGNRTERFVLALAIVYLGVFSLVETKFDRFILPAMALFLLVVAGLPSLLARRLAAQPAAGSTAVALAGGLITACLVTLAPRAIPVPRHEALARPDGPVLEWIEAHAPARSAILVESGVVPLLDALTESGQFGAALRGALVRSRPALDHRFTGATYVGDITTYDVAAIDNRRYAFAIVSRRNMQYVSDKCGAYPAVCAFYQALNTRARLAYTTPVGVEPTYVFDLR
jgi:hypothetical protein